MDFHNANGTQLARHTGDTLIVLRKAKGWRKRSLSQTIRAVASRVRRPCGQDTVVVTTGRPRVSHTRDLEHFLQTWRAISDDAPMQRRIRVAAVARVAFATTLLVAGLALAAPKPGGSVPTWAVAVFPSGSEFTLEIAASDADRARGYMFRESVGPREGMLFLFEGPGTHSIWMKNCKVALDIIWLDADFNVVHIEHERPPCPPDGECPAVAPMRLSRYVLEIAGGMAVEQKLTVGDRLVILSDPAVR